MSPFRVLVSNEVLWSAEVPLLRGSKQGYEGIEEVSKLSHCSSKAKYKNYICPLYAPM